MFRSGMISFVDRLSGCIQGAALVGMVLFHRASWSLPSLVKAAPIPAWLAPPAPSLLSDQSLARVEWGAVFVLVMFWGGFAVLAVKGFLLWKGGDGLSSFTAATCALLVIFGGVEWFHYYGDHDYFFTWPAGILVVIAVLVFLRAWVIDLARREYAEGLQRVDKTPVFGDAAEATPDDEREAGL